MNHFTQTEQGTKGDKSDNILLMALGEGSDNTKKTLYVVKNGGHTSSWEYRLLSGGKT